VGSLFVQDEVSLGSGVRVTLGSKIEHEIVTGWSVQPTVRAIWDVVPGQQHLWGAVSRAIRTPSAADLHIRVNFDSLPGPAGMPVVVGLIGNPTYHPEELVDVEAGYRLGIGSTAVFDITAFHGGYRHLSTVEPSSPVFEASPAPAHLFVASQFGNYLDLDTSGVEIAAHLAPAAWWRVDGSYSGLRLVPDLDPASGDPQAAAFDGNAPNRQWQVQSSLRAGRMEVGGGVFHSGPLRQLQIPAYTRADARLSFRITPQLSVEGIGQNLLQRAHAEFGGDFTVVPTLVPRSVNIHMVWRR
jgi:iron complex outermembrane receptor protein